LGCLQASTSISPASVASEYAPSQPLSPHPAPPIPMCLTACPRGGFGRPSMSPPSGNCEPPHLPPPPGPAVPSPDNPLTLVRGRYTKISAWFMQPGGLMAGYLTSDRYAHRLARDEDVFTDALELEHISTFIQRAHPLNHKAPPLPTSHFPRPTSHFPCPVSRRRNFLPLILCRVRHSSSSGR
jgi:hypothetical protein